MTSLSFSRHPHDLMADAVASGVFPGAVLLVAVGGKIRFLEAYGVRDLRDRAAMTPETVFDLASLTKPLATTLCIMYLTDRGRIRLNDSMACLFPEWLGTAKAGITFRHLLLHTGGLPDWRPYYRLLPFGPFCFRKFSMRKMILAEPLLSRPGKTVRYSDLGFMLLEWAVEKRTGVRLDRFLKRIVFDPLGLEKLFFIDPAQPVADRFAATEFCPWRRRVMKGEVHDENAFAAGGIAGHAGLFGTAEAIFELLVEIAAAAATDRNRLAIKGDTVRAFLAPDHTSGRSLGFDRPSENGSSSGRHFSAHTVGHLGFTGTSFWMDLDRDRIVVLLTNRIHPDRRNMDIRIFRPLIHDSVAGHFWKN